MSIINEIVDEAKMTASRDAKKIIIETIQRVATETAIENSVTVFNIDNDTGNYICIDGKQRLTTLVQFQNNEIPAIFNIDDEIVLKRIYRQGKKVILRPDSTNPEYTDKECEGMNQGFVISGVVIAVFKKI